MSIQPKKRSVPSQKEVELNARIEQGKVNHKNAQEDRQKRESRADKLRKEGHSFQAFAIEHNLMSVLGIVGVVVVFCCVGGYMHLKKERVSKDGRQINIELEAIEVKIEKAIQDKDFSRATELTSKLTHPIHEKWEDDSKYDMWNGYTYYDVWWDQRRREYLEKIKRLQSPD